MRTALKLLTSSTACPSPSVDLAPLWARDVDVERPPVAAIDIFGERHFFFFFVQDLDRQTEALELLDEHLEALGHAGLEDVLALDDRLIGLDPADHVVRLDGQDLLERVRRAVGLERPHLHLAEPLAAELR